MGALAARSELRRQDHHGSQSEDRYSRRGVAPDGAVVVVHQRLEGESRHHDDQSHREVGVQRVRKDCVAELGWILALRFATSTTGFIYKFMTLMQDCH